MANTPQHEPLPDNSTNSVPFNQAYWVIPGKLMYTVPAESAARAPLSVAIWPGTAMPSISKYIQVLRNNTVTHHLRSPETNQQIDLILSWVEAE